MAEFAWPTTAGGKASTTATGKQVWAAAARAMGADDLAAALEREKDWRFKYPTHVVALCERMCASPAAAVDAARGGLAAAHAAFDTANVLAAATPPLHSVLVAGSGKAGEVKVAAPSSSAASEMGPRSSASAAPWRASRARAPRPSGRRSSTSPGPRAACSSRRRGEAATGADAGKLGADVLNEAGAIAAWLRDEPALAKFDTLVVGQYIYLDGEKHVRASVACDAIAAELQKTRDVAYAYLASPGTAYPITAAMADDSRRRHAAAPLWQTGLSGAMKLGGGGYVRNYRDAVGPARLHVTDGLATVQGPNYALAKTLQNWRAVAARADGRVVSANMAPPARTASMTKTNPNVARWLDGVANFAPNATFFPQDVSKVMAALLLYDLWHPEAVAKPTTALDHPLMILQPAFHGGSPRCAYTGESIGSSAVITSFVSRRPSCA
ncbi:hypothetical protein JL722_4099 [Aureococcus anophagefferens]|nr:hypothetical protein JL722_4099 [Aureococcus anophagefferens]